MSRRNLTTARKSNTKTLQLPASEQRFRVTHLQTRAGPAGWDRCGDRVTWQNDSATKNNTAFRSFETHEQDALGRPVLVFGAVGMERELTGRNTKSDTWYCVRSGNRVTMEATNEKAEG